MVDNKIVVCPICNKRTWLRIQNGAYLRQYPIRINCINCRALIKGTYRISMRTGRGELHLLNAAIEECDAHLIDEKTVKVFNADYVAEISGELPCDNVKIYDGGNIPRSPYMKAVDKLESVDERIERLQYFVNNRSDWTKKKSIAFQLLNEGSIDYIAMALDSRMGTYHYQCNHYLQSLHCLQEVVLEETKYLFHDLCQDECIMNLLMELSNTDQNLLQQFSAEVGGTQGLLLAYRKAIEVFTGFMDIYPNLLPAETFMRFKNQNTDNIGISTCSYSDIKTFYQDGYEALLSLIHFPVCLDNISARGDYLMFPKAFNGLFKSRKYEDCSNDLQKYILLENGNKVKNLRWEEPMQKIVDIPANRFLRNGIGHNNIRYDGITQTIQILDQRNSNEVFQELKLMDMAIDCIGLAKSAVLISEIILFMLRQEFRKEGIRSIMHPRFYRNAEPNDRCPCGSSYKYKRCCRSDVERVVQC